MWVFDLTGSVVCCTAEVEATGLSSSKPPAGSNEPSKTRELDVAEEKVDWIPAKIF